MRNVFIIISSLCFLSSCRTPRYVYAPAPANTPYFKEKGNSKLSAFYSIGTQDNNSRNEQNRGLDVQAAYAITNHWALTTDLFYRREKDVYDSFRYSIFDSAVVKYKRNITSFGAGYFIPINRKKNITFNMYGGVGFGKFAINDKGLTDSSVSYSRFHNSDITKWYLQPGINFMPGEYFWFSVTTKFSFIHYNKIKTNYSADETDQFALDNLQNRTLKFFEPSFNMQFTIPRSEWLKVNGGFTFSGYIKPKGLAYENNHDGRGFTGSIGIGFDFSKIGK